MASARIVDRKRSGPSRSPSLGPLLVLFLVSGCGESTPAGPAAAGSIQLTTVTTGSSLDPDGYTLTVDGEDVQPIGLNETVTLTGLAEGVHEVGLADVAWDCKATGANPKQIAVVADETVSTSFEVRCVLHEIAFVRRFSTGGNGIYAMAADGSSPVKLRSRLGSEDWELSSLAWAPDGGQMALSRGEVFGWEPSDVWLMDADGTNPINLTENDRDNNDESPTWSPDGTKIAFTTNRDGDDEVYVMDADGSNPVNLTSNPAAHDGSPAWSPDGTRIAFSRALDGDLEIYVMGADGSNPVNLTNHPAGDDRSPAWSPDGTRIAFSSDRDGNFEVYVMDADGSDPVNLTRHPGHDSAWDRPTWSPDGTRIAFTTDRDGNFEIYVMNADGSNPVNLTSNPTNDDSPAWLPRP